MQLLNPFRRRARDLEWVGGRYTLPAEVHEGDAVIRPEIILWLELPSGVVVGSRIIDPRKPVSFAETLEDAMRRPVEGSPRRPARIRVPDDSLAEALRGSVGSDVVVVAPVPELDAAFDDLRGAFAGVMPEHSYLGGGTISPALVGELFSAASLLFRAEPWRHVSEEQVVRVDIPALQVDGACLSIIGAAGESFGLLLFRSLEAYLSFVSTAGRAVADERPARHTSRESSLISLSFDRKKDLPPSMAREIERHRWPVAGAKAYPALISIGADMNRRPTTGREVRVMTACTRAFVTFLARHRSLFEDDEPEPICESVTGDDGVTVTFTAPCGEKPPFPMEALFGLDDRLPERAEVTRAVGRNEPCPCGSGKKYKKCHLGADRAPKSASSPAGTVHDMDFRLVSAIGRFASSRFGPAWLEQLGEDIDRKEPLLQLYLPWAAWTAVVDGKRIADSFLEQNEGGLSDEERDWFAAQRRVCLSIWEVTRVEPGTIDVRDLLTGERRSVREEKGSRSVVARDTLLARVLDFRGVSLFGGLYGRVLPPTNALEVIDAVRSKLRARKGDVAVERLQDPIIGRFMIDRWMEAVDEYDERRSIPPKLENTDGDPLLLVTESFPIEAAARPEIEKRLAAMDGIDAANPGKKESEFVFVREGNRMHRSWENTVVGRVMVTGETLRVETNSEKRAEALGRRVRDALAGMLRTATRKTEDPSSMRPAEKSGAKKPEAGMSPKEQAMLREIKEAHYREWIDTPIPVLGGKTPRAALRSAKSRERLDLLLRDMENQENRVPEAARFDVQRLRHELGLDP